MKSNQYILGIDPGNRGACALLSLDGTEIDWFKMPTRTSVPGTSKKRIDGFKLYNHLSNFNIVTCYIEKQAYKNAVLNANYGICMGVLDVLGIDFVAIQSSSWIKSLKVNAELDDIKQGSDKAFTFYAFDKIFPSIELPMKGKERDDDIADACLIAWLCYLHIEKERD